MKKYIIVAVILAICNSLMGQIQPYAIYDKTGKQVNIKELVNKVLEAELIFFGELHNNSMAHWLQIKMLKQIKSQTTRQVIVGMEMFETDNQMLINEYLSGAISEKNFEEEAKLWKNYKTDYKVIVLFAKQNNIPIIATNTPRRYAAMVNNSGFEALEQLSFDAKSLIAPLPIEYNPELPGYTAMKKMTSMHGIKHSIDNLPKAQALKDATMAHFIVKNYNDRSLFFHINGSYHTNNNEGIIWYINRNSNNFRIVTINSVTTDNVNSIDQSILKSADYTVFIDSDITNSY